MYAQFSGISSQGGRGGGGGGGGVIWQRVRMEEGRGPA